MKTKAEFEPRQYMPDGLWHKCKECRHPSYTPEEAAAVKAKIRAYDPEYFDRVEQSRKSKSEYYKKNTARRLEYNARPERKAITNALCKKYQKAKPHMRAAHIAVAEAVRKGILKRPLLCSRCSRSGPVHGHHHDYDKQLDVTWLCPDCHAKEHVAINDDANRF